MGMSIWGLLVIAGVLLVLFGGLRLLRRRRKANAGAPQATAGARGREDQPAVAAAPPRRGRFAETVTILAGIVSILVGLVTLLEKLK